MNNSRFKEMHLNFNIKGTKQIFQFEVKRKLTNFVYIKFLLTTGLMKGNSTKTGMISSINSYKLNEDEV